MLICLIAAVVLTTACATTVAGVDWEDSWEDGEGKQVSEDIVHSDLGAGHCDWESVVFLWVQWPFAEDSDPAWMYVRDPDEKYWTDGLKSTFAPNVALAEGARFTGYRRGDAELWAGRTTVDREVYLVFPERVERWPRAREFGCD